MSFVLDSSAVIAAMLGERGADIVRDVASPCEISTVNVGEVFSKFIERGVPFDEVKREFGTMRLWIRSFREIDAWRVGQLRPLTKQFGLSLGDRACIATAELSRLPVLTSDGDLAKAGEALGIDIRMIR